MRSAFLTLAGTQWLSLGGVLGVAFAFHTALVHLGARLARFEGGARWAVWSVGMASFVSLAVVWLAGWNDVVVPSKVQLGIELVVLSVALRLNYFQATLVRAVIVATFAMAFTLGIAVAVARIVEAFFAQY